MTSWDVNKVIGAVLASVLFILAMKMIVMPIVFYVPPPTKPGYVVQGVEETTSGATQAAAEETIPDWGTVLPKADVAAGQQTVQACGQCHDWSKGGPDKIGPNLWGVVGRPRASRASFSYSSAMSSSHGPWTYDKLFVYLKSPAGTVPGTKMTYAGLRSEQQRINLIAYLRTQSDSPLPIPPPAPAKAAAPANAPAKGGAAPPAATNAPAIPAQAPANGAQPSPPAKKG